MTEHGVDLTVVKGEHAATDIGPRQHLVNELRLSVEKDIREQEEHTLVRSPTFLGNLKKKISH